LDAYRERRARWLEVRAQAAEMRSRSKDRRDRLDLLRFQSSELASARLSVDEHASLLRERAFQASRKRRKSCATRCCTWKKRRRASVASSKASSTRPNGSRSSRRAST